MDSRRKVRPTRLRETRTERGGKQTTLARSIRETLHTVVKRWTRSSSPIRSKCGTNKGLKAPSASTDPGATLSVHGLEHESERDEPEMRYLDDHRQTGDDVRPSGERTDMEGEGEPWSQRHSLSESQAEFGRESSTQEKEQEPEHDQEQEQEQEQEQVSKLVPESEHVKDLRSLLETDADSGWTLRLSMYQSRESVELLQRDSTGAEQLTVRYVRWSREGYDTIARTLAAYLRRQPAALRKLADRQTLFEEKLQILLDSDGLDWQIEACERSSQAMACIEITAPGTPRGTRTRIGRFATGWYAAPENIACGLFKDWAARPEAVWMLRSGRREWEEETRRIGVDDGLVT